MQGAQVMAVTALRIADLDDLLPRDKPDRQGGQSAEGGEEAGRRRAFAAWTTSASWSASATRRCRRTASRSSIVVGRPNYDKNRTDTELVLVDVATGKQRVLTHDRHGVGQPRWSPDGDRLAFLARAGTGKDAQHQVFVLPMNGGDALRDHRRPDRRAALRLEAGRQRDRLRHRR